MPIRNRRALGRAANLQRFGITKSGLARILGAAKALRVGVCELVTGDECHPLTECARRCRAHFAKNSTIK